MVVREAGYDGTTVEVRHLCVCTDVPLNLLARADGDELAILYSKPLCDRGPAVDRNDLAVREHGVGNDHWWVVATAAAAGRKRCRGNGRKNPLTLARFACHRTVSVCHPTHRAPHKNTWNHCMHAIDDPTCNKCRN